MIKSKIMLNTAGVTYEHLLVCVSTFLRMKKVGKYAKNYMSVFSV